MLQILTHHKAAIISCIYELKFETLMNWTNAIEFQMIVDLATFVLLMANFYNLLKKEIYYYILWQAGHCIATKIY